MEEKMNERIQEFILQATVTTDVYNPDTGITHYREFFDHEKFAELIIKETLQVAKAGVEFGPSMEEAVYTYFGVKE
jgi:hypothetical protein